MARLTLNEYVLILRDFLGVKLELFASTHAAALYVDDLRDLLRRTLELPSVILADKSLTQALAEDDDRHDAYGGAFWLMGEAYLTAPGVSEALRRDVQELRAALLPERSELKAAYALEAERANQRLAGLDEQLERLRRFPLAEGSTLEAWVRGMLQAGQSLGELLRQRADKQAEEGSRKEAVHLRSLIQGTLSKLRSVLRDEVRKNQALPRDLEARVFAYLDELERLAEQRSNAKPGKPADAEAS